MRAALYEFEEDASRLGLPCLEKVLTIAPDNECQNATVQMLWNEKKYDLVSAM